jgi:hypothetical protein
MPTKNGDAATADEQRAKSGGSEPTTSAAAAGAAMEKDQPSAQHSGGPHTRCNSGAGKTDNRNQIAAGGLSADTRSPSPIGGFQFGDGLGLIVTTTPLLGCWRSGPASRLGARGLVL